MNEEAQWVTRGQYSEPIVDQIEGEIASINVPKANFYDYQYQEGPSYRISFDPRSG